MSEAFPLRWPEGWPRTPSAKRQRARFGTRLRSGYLESLTIAEATRRLIEQIYLLGARSMVISSDMPVRRDGLPLSGRRAPDDPAVAIYFMLQGRPHCLPCDRWDRLADNIAAVAAHIDAVRAQERYGVGDIARAFAGFVALPPASQQRPWWEVLGIDRTCTRSAIIRAWRDAARRHHPDHGGSDAQMAEINAARDAALRART